MGWIFLSFCLGSLTAIFAYNFADAQVQRAFAKELSYEQPQA